MVHLLTFRASVDASWHRLISESEIAHCKNETKASKAINGVEAHYMVALCNTEAIYAAAMRWEEAAHSASTREVEATHTTVVREEEAARAAQTSKLQQTHWETMQALEDEALEEERYSHQSFLWACGVGLQACPNKALGKCMYPIHLLTGNMPLTGLLMVAPKLSISSRDPVSSASHARRPTTTTHPTGNKQQHLPRCEAELVCSRDGEPASHPGEPPQQRQREEDPLSEHLRGTCREAFHKDVDLVQHIRQTYFRAHLPVFYKEVTHGLANVFREMAKWWASWSLKSTQFRISGGRKRNSIQPTMWPRDPLKTYAISGWCHPLNCLK